MATAVINGKVVYSRYLDDCCGVQGSGFIQICNPQCHSRLSFILVSSDFYTPSLSDRHAVVNGLMIVNVRS